VTKTLPSRFRFSTMARRRSSLSTGFDPPGGIAGKKFARVRLMVALSFYIVCFRLSNRKSWRMPRRLA
jgi:hypothetical protein